MHMEGNRISLPVSVVSGNSGNAKKNDKVVTESFSTEYKGLLPNQVLLEIGKAFKNSNGKSLATIVAKKQALSLLCKFMVQSKIGSLQELDFGDLGRLRDFIQVESTYQKDWYGIFSALKSNNDGTALADMYWPKTARISCTEGTTPAHSLYAYDAMGVALRREIDRIREKKGCLAEAMKIGKLIKREDLELDGGKRKKGTLLPKLRFSKADIICTIIHYLPGWPVINKTGRRSGKWAVYTEYCGVRLGIFETREEATKLAAKHGGTAQTVVVQLSVDQQLMNPAELLLFRLKLKKRFHHLGEYLRPLFQGIEDIIDTYYPTIYDWSCVYLYWLWITGWNNETIASVVASDLKLGIDIGEHNIVEVIAPDHIEINGKLPTHWKRGGSRDTAEPRDKGEVVTGYKTRSQPEDAPKPYSYICDKSDPYDLYLVLADFFELTEPLRGFLNPSERDCILMGVVLAGIKDKGRAISLFGNADHCTTDSNSNLKIFFERNPIYDDDQEFLVGPHHKMETATDNPAASPERYSRIWKTSAMKMRTTHEAWLESKEVPLWMRRAMMGHESEDTTMTSYGSEKVSIGIRQRRLNGLLNEVEQKIFKGQLSRWEDAAGTARKAGSSNVIQIFSYLKSDIFFCENPKKPMWPGHEEYVDGHCTEFDECLFCEQCTITKDSLPVLIRWLYNIKEMPKLVGPAGISDKVYLRKQAIEEVLALCRNEGREWRETLEKAYEIEKDPAFTAPDFIYRQVMLREG